ncbi:hypothetical protein PSHT_04672 [Puccinia striiformis]|uniref:GCM domain-containing protein n=1 Tax=Puccinia striiformis TaxID=27350 RepID=A0A2S4WCD1_9BASI|nr:hypothetical protein PSHT_04672 [Puccinia striiformis]
MSVPVVPPSSIPQIPSPAAPVRRTNFAIPLTKDQGHQTYIDHDCIPDKQGYPLYPNRSTVYVRPPGQDITNFGKVGFTHTSKVAKRSGGWKVTTITCLGVLLCDNPSCDYTGPPPTGRGKIQELLDRKQNCPGAAGACSGTVYWRKCTQTKIRVDLESSSGWALLRHKGFHDHPWPTSKKPDPLAAKEFAAEIMKNPKATAIQLKVGTPLDYLDDTHPPFESVADIHGCFQNADRVRYHKSKVLAELKLGPQKKGAGVGDAFMLEMFAWDQRGMTILSSSFRQGQEHFSFQTAWMQERLLARSEEGNTMYSGGLLSDVTYRFFDTGYLLTTCMYCEQIQRWIPVLLTFIRGLSEDYYQIHFAILFRQFIDHSITEAERQAITRSVVDFSAAQRKGFIAAYVEVFKTSAKEAGDQLKGCKEHFRQSVTRIKRNRGVVTSDEVNLFTSMCEGLLLPTKVDGPTHEMRIDEIRRRFPKAKRWIDWWSVADVESTLFPSRRKMLEDSPDGDDGLPESTNAQESMHRVYYMFSSGKKPLLVGMVELYAFTHALERDWRYVMGGNQIAYGTQRKKQVDIAQSLGWSKATKRQKAAWNDGRAPDTTEALDLDGQATKKKGKVGRPRMSPNIDRSPDSTFVSYVALPEADFRNRCWLAALLESLYTVFSPLWMQTSGGKSTELFLNVVTHFTNRMKFELTKSNSVRSILTRGSKKIFNDARNLYPQSIPIGDYASADFFMEATISHIANTSKSLPSLFLVHEERVFSCPVHPGPQPHSRGSREVTVLRITPSMFDDNEISRTNASQLISMWSSGGITGLSGLACQKCTGATKTKKKKSAVELPSRLSHTSTLGFVAGKAPLHLYFLVELATITGLAGQLEFMSSMDWPFKIEVAGEQYTLMSRGFWNGNHYWGKVLRDVNGKIAIWLQEDHENDGYARKVSDIPGSIGGAQANTSWLIYSRVWSAEESATVDQKIAKIRADNPTIKTGFPFVRMGALLNIGFYADKCRPVSLTGQPPHSLKIRIKRKRESEPSDVVTPITGPQIVIQPASLSPGAQLSPALVTTHLAPPTPVKRRRRRKEIKVAPSQPLLAEVSDPPPPKRIRPNQPRTVEATSHSHSQPAGKTCSTTASPTAQKIHPAVKKAPIKRVKKPLEKEPVFQPKPLTDKDYDRMEACSRSYREGRDKAATEVMLILGEGREHVPTDLATMLTGKNSVERAYWNGYAQGEKEAIVQQRRIVQAAADVPTALPTVPKVPLKGSTGKTKGKGGVATRTGSRRGTSSGAVSPA